MSRFSNSDKLGVQNNRRLSRRERLYNNRTSSAGVPVPHPSRSMKAHFQSPSANPRASRKHYMHVRSVSGLPQEGNPFELLNSVSAGDSPYHGGSGSCAYRVTKHQYTRRNNKRAALRRRHLDEIDGILSSCVNSAIENEEQKKTGAEQKEWLTIDGPEGLPPPPSCHLSSTELPNLDIPPVGLPVLYKRPSQELCMIKWQPLRWSRNSSCDSGRSTPHSLIDIQAPWPERQWLNWESSLNN